jgi:hypothetical protein
MVSFAAALDREQIEAIRIYVIARANQDYVAPAAVVIDE